MCDIPKHKTDELDSDCWRRVIEGAVREGARTIVFSGGEPLLRRDIFELISFVKEKGVTACITSNGMLIDDAIACKLFESGVGVVNISIEGPQEVHDHLRGQGAFVKAIEALEILKQHEIETTVASMVCRHNYAFLDQIIELAKHHGATTVKFQPFSTLFLDGADAGGDFFITDSEIPGFREVIDRVISLSVAYGIATNPAGYLKMMPDYLSRKNLPLAKNCSVLYSSCPINARGEIYPCWVFSDRDMLLGDLKKDTFSVIWNSSRRRAVVEKINEEGCPGCLMSCYDDNFGNDDTLRKMVTNIQKVKNQGFPRYTKRLLGRWVKRFRFYRAYRGPLKMIHRRMRGFFVPKAPGGGRMNEETINSIVAEIRTVKQLLKDEIKT